MKHTKKLISFLMAFTVATSLAFTQIGCSQQQQQPGDKPLAKENWMLVELQASVEAIDHKKREVTLKGPAGNLVTITASEQVKRFNEIKVGDSVKAEYWTFLRAEFREPTVEEKENPLVVLAEAGKAPKEVDPAAVVGAVVKAVVKVVAIDIEGREAAIQGPRGGIMILPVMDDAVLMNLKVGEVVIMTYAEAMAVSLVKRQ